MVSNYTFNIIQHVEEFIYPEKDLNEQPKYDKELLEFVNPKKLNPENYKYT